MASYGLQNKFFSIESLNTVCGILQIVGFILIILNKFPVIIGASGFAAIVKIFLPLPDNKTFLGVFFAALGVTIIIMYAARDIVT